MSTRPTQSYPDDAYKSLMRDLRELDFQGPYVPSNLLLTGDHAFPLAMNSRGQALMAASLYGKGRIVVLGHEGYLTTFPALVENALTWLRGDGSDNLSVGVHKNIQAVADNLSKSIFKPEVVEAFSNNLRVGVYVTDAYSVGTDGKDLVAFMKAGGGVLIAGQACHWSHTHPKENTLLQFAGNKVSGVAGIYFTEHYGAIECLPVYPQFPSSWMAVDVGKDFEDDLEFLLQGISEFDIQGKFYPCDVMVHGPLAFPIGTTKDGQAFLAGTYYGLGRVIVATHGDLLKKKTLTSFWNNAIDWLDQGRKGVIGLMPSFSLCRPGLTCENTKKFRKDFSVFVCSAHSHYDVEEIQDFVAEGGGLLIGGQVWHWAYKHPWQDFPGNKILNRMGLSLLGTILKNDSYKAPVPSQAMKDNPHFRHLLRRLAGDVISGEKLIKHEEQHLAKLDMKCLSFLNLKAYNSYYYTQVVSLLVDILKKYGMPQASEKNPVKNPQDRFLLSVGTEIFNVAPDRDALLPYLIKNNPTMSLVNNQSIRINSTTAGSNVWHSTGLYLAPGMETELVMPAEIINKGWKVQISCQTDRLRSKTLKRAPCVYKKFAVTTEKMQVWNLWGGLIYLVSPPNTNVERAEITVQKAVLAPYYKSGVTTEDDWASLRTAPSPWAEFEFDNIILTVPSHLVRELERPDEVATLWNDIMKGVADLAVIPHKFARKERIVADVQISAGLLHAGYPIMTQTFIAAALLRPDNARTKGLWGEVHELGHNQQRGCWEFRPHTTEATCNLWSVYVHEEVLGVDRAKAARSLKPGNRERQIKKYVEGGRILGNWNVWVALETYLQLQEKFGWDAFKKVFAAYHKMSNFPKDNKGKMNLYAETFSQTVGMNLTGFFKAWGWPIASNTEEKLSNLPSWTDHPMVQYG